MDIFKSKKIYPIKDEYRIGNGDILVKRRHNTITIKSSDDLKSHDFKNSVIFLCTINNEDVDKLKYKSVLEKIYTIINNKNKIMKNTKLDVITLKKEEDPSYYLEEIINQCEINKIKIDMKIMIMNGSIINLLLF